MVRVYGVLVLCLCCLYFVSADIFLETTPREQYNIGDVIHLSFTVAEELPINDYVTATLSCDGYESVIFKQLLRFSEIDSQNLTVVSIANTNGTCFIAISFAGDSVTTASFVVSSHLTGTVLLNGKVFTPGSFVLVNGTVRKYSNTSFNYTVQVTLDSIEKSISAGDSSFSLNVSLPMTIPSGSYALSVTITERDAFDDLVNEYVYETTIEVLSQPSSILIVGPESVNPPSSLNVSVSLLDQTQSFISDERIAVTVFDPHNNLVYDDVVVSGESIVLPFAGDALLGGWRVNAHYAGISSLQPVYVLENRQVSIEVTNGTSFVLITNVGNIPYQGLVEVTLENASGSFVLPVHVDLGVGSIYEAQLLHSGDFNVSLGNQTFSNVFITGGVVGSSLTVPSYIFWIILAFLIGLSFSYVFFRSRDFASHAPFQPFLFSRNRSVIFNRNPSPSLSSSSAPLSSSLQTPVSSPAAQTKRLSPHTLSVTSQRQTPVSLGSASKPSPSKQKNVYSLFFRQDSEDLVILLKRYGLNIYKVGDMRFSLLKSSKSPESLLLRLAQIITTKTAHKDVLLHCMTFEESHRLSSFFGPIKRILVEGEGILVSSTFLKGTSEPKSSFVFFRTLHSKESVLKLYRYVALE